MSKQPKNAFHPGEILIEEFLKEPVEEIAEELGYSIENFNFDRQQKSDERKSKEIGFSSIRGGNIPGEHTVIFHGDNESIELTHKSYNRKIFSDGAIEAANWLVSQKNGLYSFRDMIT